MAHRRTSGAKVRCHKLGFNNLRFETHKKARLHVRRWISDCLRLGTVEELA